MLDLKSKNVYIDKLDEIVNKYNNAYHKTIKMKPLNVKPRVDIEFNKKIIRRVENLKLVIM